MLKLNHKKAQAITELAIFGAILIYLLGSIVRTAASNSLTQNQNFKAMRMAMLKSWESSKKENISRNSASVLIIEDRLSPDVSKYGALDRTPYIANGSGTFSYELLYGLTPGLDDMQANMPVMDFYINGQYFPLTTAAYRAFVTLPKDNPTGAIPGFPQCNQSGGPYSYAQGHCQTYPQQCMQNQCLRYQRDWGVSTSTQLLTIKAKQFNDVIQPVTVTDPRCQNLAATATQTAGEVQRICQAGINGFNIFNYLTEPPSLIINPTDIPFSTTDAEGESSGTIDNSAYPLNWPTFEANYLANPPVSGGATSTQTQLGEIKATLRSIQVIFNTASALPYKLFYTLVANPILPQTSAATPSFSLIAPTCLLHPCKNKELSADRTIGHLTGQDLMFDLTRNDDPNAVVPPTPAGASVPDTRNLRPYISWQWAATAAVLPEMIGLNTSNNEFPTYDIDGRLKEVTIYSLSYNLSTGEPTVSYVDPQGGDIDPTWDANSFTPRPGLQNDAEIYSFTADGTYLQIKEGKLFNPETGAVVRSATKRDTIDLISRMVQLSSNTGRFCPVGGGAPLACIANDCKDYPPATMPNPVEACASGGSGDNCFSTEFNIKSTCFDLSNNMLYVRSRLQDMRGHFWMTNTSGQMKVQQ